MARQQQITITTNFLNKKLFKELVIHAFNILDKKAFK